MIVGWLLAAVVVVGHFALHLTLYNRLNSTGLPRRRIKTLEIVLVATCALIPVVILWLYHDVLTALWHGSLLPADLPWPLALYSLACIATVFIYGPAWLLSRPFLHRDAIPVQRSVARVRVDRSVAGPLARTRKCRWHLCIPGNQIFDLAVEYKELPVVGLPPQLEGFRIAHVSDIHLTGHVAPNFVRYAIDTALRWQPDLFALTGDIVDKQRCVDWLVELFGNVEARYGCHFVLGNHDLRVSDPGQVRANMMAAGWNNLGGRELTINVDDLRVRLIGNEAPWFPPAPLAEGEGTDDEFRLLLSHSPDQLQWARRRDVRLMLAGHTHGGQGRLPWIGPVLSPSRYGSRYASGSFYVAPTTMHVSRGLSGVHLLRINCPPELALLTLRKG